MKNVLVTGASAGFGFDTVKELAGRGHTVFATMRDVSSRNVEKANELQDWADTFGHSVHVIELDVVSDRSVEQAIASTAAHGGIDVLINNAGVGTWGLDEGYSVEQAQRVFDINLFGVMRLNKAVLPHFRRAGKGLIIYVSSGLGRIILPFMGIYTASKFALEGFAESSSYELQPLGIDSVIIQPGAYGTTFLANCLQPAKDVILEYGRTADMFAAFGGAFEELARSGALGDPEEVVQAIAKEVEYTGSERPLRRPIGKDVVGPVSAINRTCDQIQDQLLNAFGLKQTT